MRFALANLMDEVFGLGGETDTANMFGLIPNDDGPEHTRPWKTIENFAYSERSDLPMIAMSHLPRDGRFEPEPVVLLMRNPAASLVSRFFHMSRHAGQFEGGLAEFARDEFYGVPGMVSYFASWEPHVDDPNVLVVTYEHLRSDPVEPFGQVVSQLGFEADGDARNRALEAASVERMRAVEKQSGVGQPNDYDRSDPTAMRVRRASVSAWQDEIDDQTLDYLIESFQADGASWDLLGRYGLQPQISSV